MLTFDEHGHLIPDQPIESTLEELETVFVFNEHRAIIFTKMKEFFAQITNWYPGIFWTWIDGSFVTKKEFPKDIDCVLFIDFKWLNSHEVVVEKIRNAYSGLIDAYFVSIYPENHPLRIRTDSDRIRWLHFFTTDREKLAKGLVQINFHEDGNQ